MVIFFTKIGLVENVQPFNQRFSPLKSICKGKVDNVFFSGHVGEKDFHCSFSSENVSNLKIFLNGSWWVLINFMICSLCMHPLWWGRDEFLPAALLLPCWWFKLPVLLIFFGQEFFTKRKFFSWELSGWMEKTSTFR